MGVSAGASPEKFYKEWPQLRAWYRQGARDLPWRKGPVDPYRIWISEVMSQQSTLKTVIPYFEKWLSVFPDLESLAAATPEKVLKYWAGLGYYSRARNIHAAAQALNDYRKKHSKRWPESPEEWREFKGVGPYTAAAVTAIAFGKKIIPIDGNVLRVASRYWGIPDPLNLGSDRKKVEKLLELLPLSMKKSEMPVLAQAFMELGALVCKPAQRMLCELCPLAPSCVAKAKKKQGEWPIPKKRAQVQEKWILASMWGLDSGQLCLRQIPRGERLEGQWELPQQELSKDEFAKKSKEFNKIGPVSHSITRYRYKVLGDIRAGKKFPSKTVAGQKFHKVDLKKLDSGEVHVSTLTLKLLQKWRTQHKD